VSLGTGSHELTSEARPFPVSSLSPESIETAFAAHAHDVAAKQIGIGEREIRSGYSGLNFLTSIAR